jgi:DnaJ-class molecular chaperone
MISDYEGQIEPPNKLDDAIGFHEWFEANVCLDCDGSGRYRPKSDSVQELYKAHRITCQACGGRGVIPEMFDPNY